MRLVVAGLIVALASGRLSAGETYQATYYEVWRGTVNDIDTADRIGQWLTATTYNDITAAAGQVYYYWVRSIHTSIITRLINPGLDVGPYLYQQLTCPTAAHVDHPVPVRVNVRLSNPDAVLSGSIYNQLLENDLDPDADDVLDHWTAADVIVGLGDESWEESWTRDVRITDDSNQAQVSLASDYTYTIISSGSSGSIGGVTVPFAVVNLRTTFDAAPTPTATTNDPAGLTISWNPTPGQNSMFSDVCQGLRPEFARYIYGGCTVSHAQEDEYPWSALSPAGVYTVADPNMHIRVELHDVYAQGGPTPPIAARCHLYRPDGDLHDVIAWDSVPDPAPEQNWPLWVFANPDGLRPRGVFEYPGQWRFEILIDAGHGLVPVDTKLIAVVPELQPPENCKAHLPVVCSGAWVALSATPGAGGDLVDWFTGACGETLVATGNTLVNPTETTTYYARTRDSTYGLVSESCSSAVVTVTAPCMESEIAFTLALGGNNRPADYEAGLSFPAYVPGSTADGRTWHAGEVLTWEVRARVSGNSVYGVPTNGAANLVFNLKLHEGSATGPLVNIGRASLGPDGAPVTAGWFSSLNDGDAGGCRGRQLGPDPTYNAAFTSVFDLAGHGALGGRIFDCIEKGGPCLSRRSYPSSAGWPYGSTAYPGTLMGMGAGYRTFEPIDTDGDGLADQGPAAGVGIVGLTAGGCPGLGDGPFFEGQISTIGLPPGDYVLRVIGGVGNNVLRGDIDCFRGTTNNFAQSVMRTVGDEIAFRLVAAPCDDGDADGICDPWDLCPYTIAAVPVNSDGCPTRVAGDFDRDGDVDPNDHLLFEACSGGPSIAVAPGCQAHDLDGDRDVDQDDFGLFQRIVSGVEQPAELPCESQPGTGMTALDDEDAKGSAPLLALMDAPILSGRPPCSEPFGDTDGDADVGPSDFQTLQQCVADPAWQELHACACLDYDHNGRLDQSDFGVFQRCFSGDGNPPEPECANH